MDKTNYQKVVEFNKTFGHPAHDKPQYNVWDDQKLVKLRVDLIKEEFNELQKAVADKDMKETVDALSDILYVVYGFFSVIGVDGDIAMGMVHESNMSKICQTEQEAKETVEWYRKEFAEKRLEYDSPKYRQSDDGKRWVVFNESSGKILKSIKYFPVEFSGILK
jgi:predicted HAD superfamily Cof-like phosphohydrolase